MTGVFRSATVPTASAIAARAGSRVGRPCRISAAAASSRPATASAASAAPSARSSSWNPIVAIANFSVFAEVTLVRLAVHAEQADRRGDRRLRLARRVRCSAASVAERRLVADLADREDGIVLQRTVELGDLVIGASAYAAR